jgi:hypothetical protein
MRSERVPGHEFPAFFRQRLYNGMLVAGRNGFARFQYYRQKFSEKVGVGSFTSRQELEYLFPLLVLLVGFIVGILVLWNAKNPFPFFYQIFMREAVMWACGHGLVDPVVTPPEMTEFLFNKRTSLSCDVVTSVGEVRPLGIFVRSHFLLAGAVGLLWRIFGVAYASLWPLFGAMLGMYALAVYAFVRQFFGRFLALGVALLLTFSPVTAGALNHLRDFSKAPFILGTLALLIFALRRGSLQPVGRICLGAGAILGIGYGFRTDVLIVIPIGILMLVIGLPSVMSRAARGLCVASFLLGTFLFAAPTFLFGYGSGGLGAMVMEGSVEPFVKFMDLREAPYSLGWHYSDELTLSSIAADLIPVVPDWNKNEGEPMQAMTQAFTRSTAYLLTWGTAFTADFATRALKSAFWIAGFETFVRPEHTALDPAGDFRAGSNAGILPDPVLRLFGASWMPWIGLAGLLALLLLQFDRSPRLALAVGIMLLSLLTYPAIQFSVRHIFYLEVVQWLALLALPTLLIDRKPLRQAPRFMIWVLGFAIPATSLYTALLFFQDRMLKKEVSHLLTLQRQSVSFERLTQSDGKVRFLLPVPEHFHSLVTGAPDAMHSNLPLVGGAHRVMAGAERLLITIQGCSPGRVPITFLYEKTPEVWQPLDHTITVPVPSANIEQTLVIAPVLYRATQYFSGLEVHADAARCIKQIDTLPHGMPGLPIVFSAVLPPQWDQARFYLGFGGFGSKL